MTDTIKKGMLPAKGLELVEKLNQAGYEAWFVGGCVRDLLMGNEPNDWDICTDAKPEETKACLGAYPIHETGIQHGTVLVLNGGEGFEITTYRTEQVYSDHRRPDRVEFITCLSEDLARRDFTVNAMAYHPRVGLVDLYGGREDLSKAIIRTVGDPEKRFEEDALRMLRALRFAGRFAFSIDENTAKSIHAHRADLMYIAPERIFSELKGILISTGAGALLREFSDVFGEILPELKPMMGFDQRTPHHDADIWNHTIRVVEGVPRDIVLRLAALLHDVGKPDTFQTDEMGVGHFYGHGSRGEEIAGAVLRRLRCDNETRHRVECLVHHHDKSFPTTPAGIRRSIGRLGADTLRDLILLRRADIMGCSAYRREEKLQSLAEFEGLFHYIMEKETCFSLKDLALTGSDLLSAGVFKGPEIGRLLKKALNGVLEGETVNQKDALLTYLGYK